MAEDSIITVAGISKGFGRRTVLKNVSFAVKRRSIFGLLGLNGAGKTTLIKIIIGFLRPAKGIVMWQDSPLTEAIVKKKIGYLPENFLPPPKLKAIELMKGIAYFHRTSFNPRSLLRMVGLEKEADKYMGFYSRGMIQRLGVALCLLKDPEVIIMDEPTLGLDVRGQRQMFDLMADLKKRGKTIIFSSHVLSQVQTVADTVGIVNKGEMSFCGPVRELLARHAESGFEDAFLKEISGEKRGL